MLSFHTDLLHGKVTLDHEIDYIPNRNLTLCKYDGNWAITKKESCKKELTYSICSLQCHKDGLKPWFAIKMQNADALKCS